MKFNQLLTNKRTINEIKLEIVIDGRKYAFGRQMSANEKNNADQLDGIVFYLLKACREAQVKDRD